MRGAGRVVREEQRWFAVEAPRDPVDVLRGRIAMDAGRNDMAKKWYGQYLEAGGDDGPAQEESAGGASGFLGRRRRFIGLFATAQHRQCFTQIEE